jgi:hypothetical protein
MNLTNIQRVVKLTSALVRQPDLIIPWIRWSLLCKRMPFEIEMPWWSFRAIQAMDSIASGKRIFEWGTGGSTVRYGKVAQKILAIEDDREWLTKVSRACEERRLQNVEIRHCPFDFHKPAKFDESGYLRALDSVQWDIIIIDGQDHTFNERLVCFAHAENFIRLGSIIIVDDFWRYHILLSNNKAKMIKIHESAGPCRIGVTQTAFFYY